MMKSYLIMASILLFLDSIYLFLMNSYFQNQIGLIQNSKLVIKLPYVILCYLFLTFGLYFFIIKEKKSPWNAFILGIVIYSVYELTNMALFTKWKLQTVILDTLWGGTLFYLTTLLVYSISSRI